LLFSIRSERSLSFSSAKRKSVPKKHKSKCKVLGNVKVKEKQAGPLTVVIAGRRQQPLFCLNTTSAGVHSWIWSK